MTTHHHRQETTMTVHSAEKDVPYPLEGWVALKAADHLPDRERGGCTCGFAVWYGDHVAVMAYREAVDAARYHSVTSPDVFADGCVGIHQPDRNPICAGHLKPADECLTPPGGSDA